jgi:ABC-type glycerol-3-phosphate transport system permease component
MGMEDETRGFLILIVNTISIVLMWMMANVFFGIYLGYGFFEDSPGWKNIVFYLLFLASLFFLIRHLKRKWKQYL